jgi:hypothetical protein
MPVVESLIPANPKTNPERRLKRTRSVREAAS